MHDETPTLSPVDQAITSILSYNVKEHGIDKSTGKRFIHVKMSDTGIFVKNDRSTAKD